MAGKTGLEPVIRESKSRVLPLHYLPKNKIGAPPEIRTQNTLGLSQRRMPVPPEAHIKNWTPRPDSNRYLKLRRLAFSSIELRGVGTSGKSRTYIGPVKSRVLCQLSYRCI